MRVLLSPFDKAQPLRNNHVIAHHELRRHYEAESDQSAPFRTLSNYANATSKPRTIPTIVSNGSSVLKRVHYPQSVAPHTSFGGHATPNHIEPLTKLKSYPHKSWTTISTTRGPQQHISDYVRRDHAVIADEPRPRAAAAHHWPTDDDWSATKTNKFDVTINDGPFAVHTVTANINQGYGADADHQRAVDNWWLMGDTNREFNYDAPDVQRTDFAPIPYVEQDVESNEYDMVCVERINLIHVFFYVVV